MKNIKKAMEEKAMQKKTIATADFLVNRGMMEKSAPRVVNLNDEEFTLYEFKTTNNFNSVEWYTFADFLKGAKMAASTCEISSHWLNSDLIVRFDFDAIRAKMRIFIPAIWNACKCSIAYDAKVDKFGDKYRFQAVVPVGYYLESKGAVIDAFNGAAGMRAVHALKNGAALFDTLNGTALSYAFNPFTILEMPAQKYTDPRGWYFRECGK